MELPELPATAYTFMEQPVWHEREVKEFAIQAALIAQAAERERCAKLCDAERGWAGAGQYLASVIRSGK